MDDEELLKKVVKNARVSAVEEADYGLYYWKMPDGTYIGDDEGNFLVVPSMRGDLTKMAKMADAARSLGVNEGQPVFMAGQRKVTDEEYQEQLERLAAGEQPDEWDVPALIDTMKAQEAGLRD